jgi:hypothetical protein
LLPPSLSLIAGPLNGRWGRLGRERRRERVNDGEREQGEWYPDDAALEAALNPASEATK